jgi:hydrogenase expression/formation protein HypC
MQIKTIDGFVANCEARGVSREVNLFMIQDQLLDIGDFVMVHIGYAIQKVEPQVARLAWETHDAMESQDAE